MEKRSGSKEQLFRPKIAIVILAGGKSSRMGQDKALLTPPRGGSMLEHVYAIASEVLALNNLSPDLIFVSGSYPGYQSIPDILPDCGPLGGVHASLTCLQGKAVEFILFLPIDMPAIRAQTLDYLIKQYLCIDRDSPASHFAGQQLPFFLRCDKNIILLLAERLKDAPESGTRSIYALLPALNAIEIAAPVATASEFFNTNTPSEFEGWCKGVVQ